MSRPAKKPKIEMLDGLKPLVRAHTHSYGDAYALNPVAFHLAGDFKAVWESAKRMSASRIEVFRKFPKVNSSKFEKLSEAENLERLAVGSAMRACNLILDCIETGNANPLRDMAAAIERLHAGPISFSRAWIEVWSFLNHGACSRRHRTKAKQSEREKLVELPCEFSEIRRCYLRDVAINHGIVRPMSDHELRRALADAGYTYRKGKRGAGHGKRAANNRARR